MVVTPLPSGVPKSYCYAVSSKGDYIGGGEVIARRGDKFRVLKVPSEEHFVWIVSYDGPGGWEAANKSYYDSPERKAMDPDPASLILFQRTAFIDRV